MEQSKEVRFEALRENALKYMKEADRMEGQIALLELRRLEVTRQLEETTDQAKTAELVRQYEALTAQMDELKRKQQDAYAKSEDWRSIAKDMERFAAETKDNQPL